MKKSRKYLVRWVIFALLALWAGGSGAIWAFATYRQGVESSYVNLLLPWRWKIHQAAVGAAYIHQAEKLAQTGDFPQAFTRLRIGVSKAPSHLRGKLLLADFYVALKRPDQAKLLLLSAPELFKDQPAYAVAVVERLLRLQEDRLAQSFALQQLQNQSPRDELYLFLALSSAQAAFNLGNYQEAEDILREHVSETVPEKAAILVRISWERGLRDLALLKLHEAITRWPDRSDLRSLLASYLRFKGDSTQRESAVIEQIAADPLAFEPRLEYIRLIHERGVRSIEEAEVEKFIAQFRSSASAMLVLAEFGANTGQPKLVRKAGGVLGAQNELGNAVYLLEVEAHVVAGNFAPALEMISDYTAKYPEWAAQYASVFSGLKAVAACGLGRKEEALLFLDELFAQQNLRADNLVAVSARLSALNAKDLAIETLRRAVKADPQNEHAFTSLVNLELDEPFNPNLAGSLRTFLELKKPSPEIAAKAYAVLGRDQYLLVPEQRELLTSLRSLLAKTAH